MTNGGDFRGEPVLRCHGLVKRFGDRIAVDGVSFEIATGECYGLLGPNGAGKTTTISMVCGLLRRDAGEVVVAGRAMHERATHAKAAVGYVPQEVALYPDLTATENLHFFGRLYGLTGTGLRERATDVLDLVGLTDRAADRVETYSGGMQRRLNIAAGLLHEPRLLVLDEPTVGVDPQSRSSILDTVEMLVGRGIGVLYTTHYMEEAQRLCDRIGIIDAGRLIAEGSRAELVALVGEQDRVRLSAEGDTASARQALAAVPGVESAQAADGTVELLVRQARSLLPRILDAANRAGVAVTAVEVVEPDLEAVFLHLTGRALRD